MSCSSLNVSSYIDLKYEPEDEPDGLERCKSLTCKIMYTVEPPIKDPLKKGQPLIKDTS